MSLLRAATRANAIVRMPVSMRTILRSPAAIRMPSVQRSFASSMLRLGQGETDSDLCASLQQEIAYEKDSARQEGTMEAEPEWLQQFNSRGVWEIQDKAGSDEVALVRTFGNEEIRVLFCVGEVDTAEPTDELESGETDRLAAGESGEEFEDSFPVRCAISISKANKGSLNIDAQVEDGQFLIENITYYRDNAVATQMTAEADWARRGLYIGPQFDTLDEQLQAQFESYLAERDITTDLALFIPNYVEYKEQNEYCGWLEGVKSFVEA
ncbi:Mitochondrial acidic protein mam33 [Malassezia equina]|uniref:Mitochondrial acidic protein mam33 n=1 Tax=Malassezia equina TaxID=1381935 RepID=A0AAF0IXK3_9BASI|nr:Mitochondrial acidic protein mam33 [Malassezia equina]